MFQNEKITTQTGFGWSRRWWLLLVLFVALVLRVAWLIFFTKAINGEGAEYARIAENLVAGRGYVGIAMEGVELMFPPLFPLMIAAGSYVVGSSYLSAQLIALAAGVVLLLLVFGIVRDLYNENTALVAVGVAALHPILIKLSGTSLVEGLYIALLMASVYFMNRARRSPEYHSWSLAGVCAGLAYLTSPQALLLPFVFLISQLLVRQNRKLVTFRKVAVLISSFVVLALPYVVFLSTSTGTLRLEGKTIVNNELGARLLSGLSECVAGYEVTENLDAKGVWMRPNADVAKSAGPPSYRTTLGIMFSRKGFHNIGVVVKEISTGLFFGAPLITLLAFLGLLRTPWSADRASGEILLLLSVLGCLVPLMTQIHMFQERYYFFLVPFLVIWGANGIAEITQWSRESLTKLGTTFPSPRIGGSLAGGLALVGLLALMAGGFNGIGTFIVDAGPRATAVRNAGDWLATIPGDKIVMDTDTPLAFHAGARYVPMPCCDSATALRFAEKKNVNFIVLKIWTLGRRPYLQDWWSRGVPSQKATLVYSARSNPDVRILIFRLELAGAPPPALRTTD